MNELAAVAAALHNLELRVEMLQVSFKVMSEIIRDLESKVSKIEGNLKVDRTKQ